MAFSLNAGLANLQKAAQRQRFSGEGGLKSDGRWHHSRNPMIMPRHTLRQNRRDMFLLFSFPLFYIAKGLHGFGVHFDAAYVMGFQIFEF
jgi:hypothetical protein